MVSRTKDSTLKGEFRRLFKLLGIGIAIVALIGIGMIIFLFIRMAGPSEPDKRPHEVPTSAVWASHERIGNWIDCQPKKSLPENNTFFCVIYGDAGSVTYKGFFRLDGMVTTLEALREQMDYYQWGTIYMDDEREMKSVIPPAAQSYEDMMKNENQ